MAKHSSCIYLYQFYVSRTYMAWDISLGTGVSCFVTCNLQKVFELILVKEIFLTYYFNMITLKFNAQIEKCSFQNPYFLPFFTMFFSSLWKSKMLPLFIIMSNSIWLITASIMKMHVVARWYTAMQREKLVLLWDIWKSGGILRASSSIRIHTTWKRWVPVHNYCG